MNNKNFIIVALVLAVVAVIGVISYLPTRFAISEKVKVVDFPKEIGEWIAVDIPLSERDYEILETRNLIMREYKNSAGDSVYLYIVYSEDNRKVSHPPEVCLMGGGGSILDKSCVQITNSIKAIRLLMEKGDFKQLVVYWYKAGNFHTDKYLKQQLKVVLDRMLGKRTSCALIRVSTDIKDNNQEAALGLIKGFVSEIEPLLARYVP